MQALGGLGGAHGLDMDLDGGSTMIQIAGDPSVTYLFFCSLFFSNEICMCNTMVLTC